MPDPAIPAPHPNPAPADNHPHTTTGDTAAAHPATLAAYFTPHDFDGIIRTLAETSQGCEQDDLSERQHNLIATCRALSAAADDDRLPPPPHPHTATATGAGAASPADADADAKAASHLYDALLAEAAGWADSDGPEADIIAACAVLPPTQVLHLIADYPTPFIPSTLLGAMTTALHLLDPTTFPA